MKKYYTTRQAARILQVDTPKVYEYIKAGKLKAHRLGGNGTSKRHWRISESDLEQFIIGSKAGSSRDKKNLNNNIDSSDLSSEPAYCDND